MSRTKHPGKGSNHYTKDIGKRLSVPKTSRNKKILRRVIRRKTKIIKDEEEV